MNNISNIELIKKAASVINSRRVKEYTIGDVGVALISQNGNVYTGVCIDTGSGMGFCAEASAIAAMITAGESRIIKIVATWKNDDGDMYVLPPCGRCREFIKQIDQENLNAEVILAKDTVVTLSELLPHDNEFIKI